MKIRFVASIVGLALTAFFSACTKPAIRCQIVVVDQAATGHPIAGAKIYLLPDPTAEAFFNALREQWKPISDTRLAQSVARDALRAASRQADEAKDIHDRLLSAILAHTVEGDDKAWKSIADTNRIEKEARAEMEKQSTAMAIASEKASAQEKSFCEKLASLTLPSSCAMTDGDGRFTIAAREGRLFAVVSRAVPVVFCKKIDATAVEVVLTQEDAANISAFASP